MEYVNSKSPRTGINRIIIFFVMIFIIHTFCIISTFSLYPPGLEFYGPYSEELQGQFHMTNYGENRGFTDLNLIKDDGTEIGLLNYRRRKSLIYQSFYNFKPGEKSKSYSKWEKTGTCRDDLFEYSWNENKVKLEFVIFTNSNKTKPGNIPYFYAITFKNREPSIIVSIDQPEWYGTVEWYEKKKEYQNDGRYKK